MEKGENLNRRNLPTLQQLRYLTELEKEDNTRGMIARIAEKCQVSTAPVSRYLKSCCEKGLLTEDYRFTKEGQAWIENYKRILKELPSYFRSIGIPEAQLEANVRDMVENISCYTISTMLTNYKRMQSSHVREKRERLTEQFLREMLPEKSNVRFILCCTATKKERWHCPWQTRDLKSQRRSNIIAAAAG